MGVFLLGVFLAQGQAHVESFVIPDVAHDSVFRCYGGWYEHRRLPDYQIRRHGYGAPGKISGLRCGYCGPPLCLLASSLTGIPVSTTHTLED